MAHTANDSVEAIDGERLVHLATVPGCDEASGVLCVQDQGLVIAAARGSGKILLIDPTTMKVTFLRAVESLSGWQL